MVSENSTYELLARNCFHFGNSGRTGRLPSLKALRAFDAVARLNSVKAAADELCVTASAVSRQISSLEDDIGAALLKPDGRGCCLTADGRLLERGLEGIFNRISEAVDRVRRPVSGTQQVRVSAGVMFASAWLVPRLDRFDSVVPDTEIILLDLNGPADRSEQADVVIDWGMAKSDTRVVAEKLSDNEEIFPVCRPGICQNGHLAGATFLHLEHTERTWHWPEWSAFLASINLSYIPVRSHRLSAGLLWRALRGGKGVALSCSTLAGDDIRSGTLVRPVGESMATDNSYWIQTPRTALDRPEVRAFRSWLHDELATDH